MTALVLSRQGPGEYRNHQLQACPECFCEWFRVKDDLARETCKVYRAQGGDLWRSHKQDGVIYLMPATSVLICVTCEEKHEEEAGPGQKLKLVAYDHRTGAQLLLDPEQFDGRWT